MVKSLINPQISFAELKSVDAQDKLMEVDTYQTELHGIDVLIAVGKAQNRYEEAGVLFFPVYLLKHNQKVVQVGVYEIRTDQSMDLVEGGTNSLDLEKGRHVLRPLLYQFATAAYLANKRLVPDIPLRRLDEENPTNQLDGVEASDYDLTAMPLQGYEIPRERSDIFTLINGAVVPPILREETSVRAQQLRKDYQPKPNDLWLQQFLHNPHYFVVDSEKDGNCLFNAVRDAFMSINQTTTLQKLRDKLAAQANERTFRHYKDQYDLFYNRFLDESERSKQIHAEHQLVKERFNRTLDRNEQRILFQQGKQLQAEFQAANQAKQMTGKLLQEVKVMKHVDTMDKFRQALRSCDFWADPWALATMERTLNLKFVVLDSASYAKGDKNNVLVCTEPDVLLDTKGIFTPEFYVLLEHTAGHHYKLVGYKQKLIFRFTELPFDMKELIVDRCLEQAGGTFALIPEFQQLKRDRVATSKHKHSLLRGHSAADEVTYHELTEAGLQGLYDDHIVFMFYSKSSSEPLPGKGAGEHIPPDALMDFAGLAAIPDWRKKLSNFWVAPFALDNHHWASVEHYYQGAKFKKAHPEFYLSFSLDSGTELSKNPAMAKAAGSKKGIFNKTLLRPKEVQMDVDFADRKQDEMYAAQFAKFSQIPDMRDLLLATGKAKLMHYRRGMPAEEFDKLMLIRDKLRRQVHSQSSTP